jgi:hypothetical protein
MIEQRTGRIDDVPQSKPETVTKTEHPADDFGRPICDCETCRIKRDRIVAASWAAFNAGYDYDQLPPDGRGEFDYDGDGGREYADTLHANHPNKRLGHWRQIGDAVPHIESPSIVPDTE